MGLQRPGRWAALTVAVTLAHLWLADNVLPTRFGWGADEGRPQRIEVSFVRSLEPTAPPAPAAAPRQSRLPSTVAAAAQAASAPPSAELALSTEPQAEVQPAPALAEALPPLSPPLSPQAPAPAVEAAPNPTPAFEWPPSTRLSYRVSGNYRGPVEGQARVEWLREGTRYQVFMDVDIGPSFAPLMSRRVSSEGEIGPDGLQPRRFDEETRVMLREPQRRTVYLDADRVRTANGREFARPRGVQDSASQFVHLTWLYTTRPELLQIGRTVELPLALTGSVEPWIYEVLDTETLNTPAGAVETMHVKPQREPGRGGNLTAEIWVAPSLQYLPVRILIRQSADVFLDLVIERLPQQAAPGR